MIQVRKYTIEDFEEIKSWYKQRGMTLELKELPKVGFIVPNIAAGFLMQTDTTSCILEPFIANPFTLKKERDVGLDSIFEELLKIAQELGYKRVFGMSTHLKMIWRAQSFGFRVIETNSLTVVKDL